MTRAAPLDHVACLELAVAQALGNASISDGSAGGPFGAVIVKDGAVLALGRNRVTADLDPTAHAEVVAIRAACRVLSDFALPGCTLYASCEPCPLCLSAAYWARIEAVYFAASRHDAAAAGFDDAFLHAELAKPPAERALRVRHTETPGALEPFAAWRRNALRVPY